MLITREGNLVTLINVFETKPEQQQELIDAWIRFTEEVKDEPGFIGAALHRSTDGARVINYAHWRSEADFGSFLNKHGEQFAQLGQQQLIGLASFRVSGIEGAMNATYFMLSPFSMPCI